MNVKLKMYKYCYYSFKIFPRIWSVKTTRIIHHNQLLFTKFGKNLRHWINDVEIAVLCRLLNRSRQNNVKNAARCRLLNRWPKKPGDEIVLSLVSRKTKSEMAKLNGEVFWMNNEAIIELDFRKIWRILQISEPSASVDNTLLDLQNSSYPTQPHSIIANYSK